MARIRSIKPEAFQSESLSRVTLSAERTFFGLSTQVDDRGRYPDKPAQINGLLWAMRGDHTTADTRAEISELETVGLVCRYKGCDGKPYLHLVTFDDHQKVDHPSRSRLPRCIRHGLADYCGKHDGDCQLPDCSREPSRALAPDLGPRTMDLGPPPVAPATAPRDTLANTQPAAQALIGQWLDHCRKRPPDRIIGRTAQQVTTLLAENIDQADIRRGLALWHAKGHDPSTIPSFVNQAMNSTSAGTPASRRQAETDAQHQRAMERAQAREEANDPNRNGNARPVRPRALPAAGHG